MFENPELINVLSFILSFSVLVFTVDYSLKSPIDVRKNGLSVIYQNLNNLTKLEDGYYKINNSKYILVFHEPWLFELYKGDTHKEIQYKISEFSHSNRSYYIDEESLILGRKIENYYINNFVAKERCEDFKENIEKEIKATGLHFNYDFTYELHKMNNLCIDGSITLTEIVSKLLPDEKLIFAVDNLFNVEQVPTIFWKCHYGRMVRITSDKGSIDKWCGVPMI